MIFSCFFIKKYIFLHVFFCKNEFEHMKKLLFFTTMILLSVCAMAQKKVAVMDVKTYPGVKQMHAIMIRGGMETAVGNTAGYEVYDRAAFESIMKEQNFQRSGAVKDSDIKRLGEMAGVKYIIVPEAAAEGNEIYINVKMLDVETGKFGGIHDILCSSSSQEIRNACNELGKQLFGYTGTKPDGTGTKPNKPGNTSKEQTINYDNGNKYVGEVVNGKRNGQGTMYYADGGKYEGNWKDGNRYGQGTFYWADGGKYVGRWENDKRNGQGTFYWANGDIYVGDFLDNKRTGQGTYYFADGDKYVGGFENNKRNGYGTYYYISGGNKHAGNWKDGNRHGQGTYYYKDGDVDTGTWINDKRDGKFKKVKKNGKVQHATYSNGKITTDWH